MPAGELQPIEILEWKWEQIPMALIAGLPKMMNGYDAIQLMVERLTKSAHILAI